MRKIHVDSGSKFNSYTFIREVRSKKVPSGGVIRLGVFRCDCGYEGKRNILEVVNGRYKTCFNCSRKHTSEIKTTHGLSNHPIHQKWIGMKSRCTTKSNKSYKNYGGRGIKVCDEWLNFINFYNWCLQNGWKKHLQIERVDVNGDYCPENCCFISQREQKYNKRDTIYVKIGGEVISLAKLMYINNLMSRYNTVYGGIRYGTKIEYYVKKFNLKTTKSTRTNNQTVY